jgi:hypothetical protein
MMRAGAGLHRDNAGREPLEERKQIRPPQPAPQHRATLGIDAVDLKDGLGEIEADDGDSHGWLPKLIETTLHSNVAAEAVHAIKWQSQHRYMTLETIAPVADDPIIGLPLAY